MTLDDLIDEHHQELLQSSGLDTRCLLHAIAQVETTHGARRLASKHEKGYCYGSTLYTGPNGAALREQSHTYGCLAHSSFGSFQIMFITAYEMGFRGDPVDLRDDTVCLPFVIEMINRRILGRYQRVTLTAFADAYNSGNPNDLNVPEDYIDDFQTAYAKWYAALNPTTVLKA
jgi:hypothetical protein